MLLLNNKLNINLLFSYNYLSIIVSGPLFSFLGAIYILSFIGINKYILLLKGLGNSKDLYLVTI